MIPPDRFLICLVTSRAQLVPDARTAAEAVAALEAWLDEAAGRVDLVQIREPDLDARVLFDLVRRVAARMRSTSTSVVVNDRADVAAAAGASGVHVPSSGPPLDRVRQCGPPGWMVGRSIHDPAETRLHGTPDYFIFGTVFPSVSKPVGARVQGLERLAAAARSTTVPALAIGGIDAPRAADCRAAGAAGVAAISLFLPPGRAPGALGIARAADALREAAGVPFLRGVE